MINTSDARQKKNISPLSYGLGQIMKLNPVSYQWKNTLAGDQVMLGLLAQDVQKIVPEIVMDNNGTFGMRSGELIPILVKGMQEQQGMIEDLQKRMQLLEDQNRKLLQLLNNK